MFSMTVGNVFEITYIEAWCYIWTKSFNFCLNRVNKELIDFGTYFIETARLQRVIDFSRDRKIKQKLQVYIWKKNL